MKPKIRIEQTNALLKTRIQFDEKWEINLEKTVEQTKKVFQEVYYDSEGSFQQICVRKKPFTIKIFRTGKVAIHAVGEFELDDLINHMDEISKKIVLQQKT